MTINMSGGLAALSMLSGSNSYSLFSDAGAAVETRAVRAAKAQFTLAETTPPWKEAVPNTPESSQISAIKRLTSIIDTSVTSPNAGSRDIQTAFTTYKALSKLSVLATAAARTTTSSAERASLQATFAKGLADLQTYLGQAPADKVELSFGLPTRRSLTGNELMQRSDGGDQKRSRSPPPVGRTTGALTILGGSVSKRDLAFPS